MILLATSRQRLNLYDSKKKQERGTQIILIYSPAVPHPKPFLLSAAIQISGSFLTCDKIHYFLSNAILNVIQHHHRNISFINFAIVVHKNDIIWCIEGMRTTSSTCDSMTIGRILQLLRSLSSYMADFTYFFLVLRSFLFMTDKYGFSVCSPTTRASISAAFETGMFFERIAKDRCLLVFTVDEIR